MTLHPATEEIERLRSALTSIWHLLDPEAPWEDCHQVSDAVRTVVVECQRLRSENESLRTVVRAASPLRAALDAFEYPEMPSTWGYSFDEGDAALSE